MGAIDPAVFAQHSDAKLRVWFSDGGNGFQQLSPDRPFASVPYAFNSQKAETADSANFANTAMAIQAGGITKQMLGQDVLSDLNRTVTKSMLGQDVLSDLDRIVTHNDLSPQIKADLNRTVTASQMAQNTITTAQLNEQILKYLKPEITLHPQAPGLIFQWAEYEPDLAGTGKAPDIPVATQWPTDCGGNGSKFQYRGCER